MIKHTLLLLACLHCLIGCNADISVQDEPNDPVAQEYPLAFVARPLLNEDGDPYKPELAAPEQFNPGAQLFLKQNAFAESAERELLAEVFADEPYDVKDLVVSPDGDTLLFALRPPELADVADELQPRWSIWRYSRSSDTVAPAY
ncbi:hypothetical protein [Arsukibacterium sp.]|uniref:hypothetical protein n=1 Tax=Arsukibacterium sp. TaxID=1977258 RepID=UPI001BD5CA24|nr:hypothetical protein [Arsukibacterium sp.]